MKIESLKPRQVVYDVRRQKMGNTTISTVVVFQVVIKEVDPEQRFVIALWNNNPPNKCYRASVSRWKAKKPLVIRSAFGQARLANREEIKAIAQREPA